MTDWADKLAEELAGDPHARTLTRSVFVEIVATALRKAKADGIRFAIDHVVDATFWPTGEDRMAHFAPENFVNWLHNQALQIEKGQ